MLIDDILTETAKLLGMKDKEEPDEEQRQKLLTGLKHVISELSEFCFPLLKTERLKATDGFIKYSDFERTPISVRSVFSDNKSVPFKRRFDGIETEGASDEADVTYSFEPRTPEIGGETEWQGEGVPMRILEFGTATEFCLLCGLDDDAAMWDKRYRDAIEDAVFLRAPKRRIRARRWRL